MSLNYPSNIQTSGEPFLIIKGRPYITAFEEEQGRENPNAGVQYNLIIPQNIQSDDNFTYEQASVALSDAMRDISDVPGALVRKVSEFVSEITNLGGNVARATGATINPKEELLFKTPELRTHTFTFNMFAKNERDADAIVNIIKDLRKRAYPEFYGLGTGSNFFKFPYQFEIVQGIAQDNAFPTIDEAFLTSISTNYAGSGRVSLTPDLKYQAIELTLTFRDVRIYTSDTINQGL